jgi:ribosomal-protein-alanine N-acetyltransferase
MVAEDLPEVLDIERASFLSPWSEQMFREELGNPLSMCIVAQERGSGPAGLLGYLCAWYAASEVHIMNLASHPRVRGRGVARHLLRGLVAEARSRGAWRIFLEVRESNRPAQALYISEGFQVVGRRPRYYTDTGEDALLMVLELGCADEGSPGAS